MITLPGHLKTRQFPDLIAITGQEKMSLSSEQRVLSKTLQRRAEWYSQCPTQFMLPRGQSYFRGKSSKNFNLLPVNSVKNCFTSKENNILSIFGLACLRLDNEEKFRNAMLPDV